VHAVDVIGLEFNCTTKNLGGVQNIHCIIHSCAFLLSLSFLFTPSTAPPVDILGLRLPFSVDRLYSQSSV
jgi:hypothetical protein